MTRHVTIGTAGHVDHGKTALVKLITGVDTDRWEEEKRRGITIDLGFAPLDLGDGLLASIVDVPGHEDFVRNMVAGATGIDLALLVVAADEGIMPQTEEHLSILEFLGVESGVVAITKVDLPDPEWIDLVEADLGERLNRSSIAWAAPVRTSVRRDVGIAELRARLADKAATVVGRGEHDLFRMPLDRSFSMAGAGTVVTGTVWSGTVEVGNELRLLPQGLRGRVRGIQVHGEDRDRAEPGRRTALAIAGVHKTDVARGTVAVTDSSWEPTRVVDVMLTLLPEARRLSQRSRVRVHIGTAEVFARVTPEAAEIAPGQTAAARLRLEAPLVTRWGDRGIVRSYSPVTTIGGCVVIDPYPRSRPRRPVELEERAVADGPARLAAAVRIAASDGVDIGVIPTRIGIAPKELDDVIREVQHRDVQLVGNRLYATFVIDRSRSQAEGTLREYHAAHPLETGMPLELLRAAIDPPELGSAIPDLLVSDGTVVFDEGGTARLATFQAELTDQQRRERDEMVAELRRLGGQGATLEELGAVDPDQGRALAEFLVREGSLVRIGAERYYHTDALRSVRDAIVDSVRETGGAAPAQLRDATGLTRKYLIPILEWMDAEGFTRRDGDMRVLGPKAAPATGDS